MVFLWSNLWLAAVLQEARIWNKEKRPQSTAGQDEMYATTHRYLLDLLVRPMADGTWTINSDRTHRVNLKSTKCIHIMRAHSAFEKNSDSLAFHFQLRHSLYSVSVERNYSVLTYTREFQIFLSGNAAESGNVAQVTCGFQKIEHCWTQKKCAARNQNED